MTPVSKLRRLVLSLDEEIIKNDCVDQLVRQLPRNLFWNLARWFFSLGTNVTIGFSHPELAILGFKFRSGTFKDHKFLGHAFFLIFHDFRGRRKCSKFFEVY